MEITSLYSANTLFSSILQQPIQLENMANQALSSGIKAYINKNYDEAITAFKRSIGLAPKSAYSVTASNYMANAYLQRNDIENAIKAYKTSINLDPNNDATHITLGNLYFFEDRFVEAEKEYKEAVRVNPVANNHYSLGQVYLSLNRLGDAQIQFNKMQNLAPDKPYGKYGLGLTYSKQGRYEDAIHKFKEAAKLQDDFYEAYTGMGYAYADLGRIDEAQEMVDFLEDNDAYAASLLSSYMYKVDPPKIRFATADSTFLYKMPPRTLVSAMDSYLETANASKTYTMTFQFDKEMDRGSIENRFNWSIQRSAMSGPGRTYNFGQSVPATEITLAPFPDNIYYDAQDLTATVSFTMQQNATADGTIDPLHIEFAFNGEDIYGLKMDPKWDQFIGFSGVA